MDKNEIEPVQLLNAGPNMPTDYVGVSKYSKPFLGELIRPDGRNYSRLERKSFYDPIEKKHPAKTPLHVARWAIQTFTKKNDWVLDPMVGAGTTPVEALRMGRNAAGCEIEFFDVVEANLARAAAVSNGAKFRVVHRDAREIESVIADLPRFSLVVNNPPYSGDVRESFFGYAEKDMKKQPKEMRYDKRYANLGLLRENDAYWAAIRDIYQKCIARMKKNGRFVVSVKDMMRKGEPFLLHVKIGDLLTELGLTHEGTAILRHYPTTMFLNTYEKKTGKKPPLYQTILVFRKDKATR